MVRHYFPQTFKGSASANTNYPPEGQHGGAVDVLNHILLEDGFSILTEDGFEVLLEDSG